MQAVIMAGGKGTRLHSVTKDMIPKPMISIQGKPLLQWQVEALRDNGVRDLIFVTGHLGNAIHEYFQDGFGFGVHIGYYEEDEPLGTAGALYKIQAGLEGEFFLVFGDVLFDVDLMRMKKFHEKKHSDATLFVHPNAHPADSDLVVLDKEDRVLGFCPKNSSRDYWYSNCVNAGLYLLSKKILDGFHKDGKVDLEKDLLSDLCSRQLPVYAYRSSEYVKDVGTPERIAAAAEELGKGRIGARSLNKKQKAIFLECGSILNRKHGLECRLGQPRLEDCAAAAVRMINQSGYLAIAAIDHLSAAGGLDSKQDAGLIHRQIETLLGREGAYVDDIYDYSNMQCQSKEPDTEMIEICAEKYNIDLRDSWFVSSSTMDIQTGKNAGTKTALVLMKDVGHAGTCGIGPDLAGKNVLSIVRQILK